MADVRVAVRQLGSVTSPLVVLAEYTHLWTDDANFVEALTAGPALDGTPISSPRLTRCRSSGHR
jgi:hypothetical protein